MGPVDHRHRSPGTERGKLGLLAIAGATAAAWFWSRQQEDALLKRTAERLRPLASRDKA